MICTECGCEDIRWNGNCPYCYNCYSNKISGIPTNTPSDCVKRIMDFIRTVERYF